MTGSKPDITSGVAIGRSSVPTCMSGRPAMPLTPTSCASFGRSANGRFQLSARRNASVRFSGVSGKSSCTRALRGRTWAALITVASVISAIGVMPAIGSFEKLPSEYETAPMSLPSMYTGLPLIPAMTPVLARGPPSSRARIRLRRVPMTFSMTPRIRALNSSTRVPSKTVWPMPTMPGRISETLICGAAAKSPENPSPDTPRTATRRRRADLRMVHSLFGRSACGSRRKAAVKGIVLTAADGALLSSSLLSPRLIHCPCSR